jgi:hypothetical protein
MEAEKKACLINAALGGWYWKGQKRLVDTLRHHGFSHDILTWCNEWPNENYDKSCPYNIKAAAFEEAIKKGYEIIFWADCSVWPVKPVEPIFDYINDNGYYFWSSGYNCAQCCSDLCLDYFDVTRDEAEKFPDCSTSMFGVNMANPQGKEFIETWIKAAKERAFHGSREHDNQSRDPRFKFHRQDQSAASLILNKMGLKMTQPGEYSSYYPADLDKVILTMRGL